MRLLNSSTLELEEFYGTLPSYAILSHTWEKEAVSIEDLSQEYIRQMLGYHKILSCCEQAFLDGIDYVWIDTCCIDKRSSSELSEAINSMYAWYRSAEVCYAFLADVRNDEDTDTENSGFRNSRWFTRGWTLQELLAPSSVVFYDKDWVEIGTRWSLRDTLSQITGIDKEVLGHNNLSSCSVATKMSWASKRKTTRVEDIAYCLMGIFDVNMPMVNKLADSIQGWKLID